MKKYQMYFLLIREWKQHLSQVVFDVIGWYLPAPYTTLKGHEKDGYSSSEEIRWGYKKSGFHCRAKQSTWVINDFGLSLWILIQCFYLKN